MVDVRTLNAARPTGERREPNVSGIVSYQQPVPTSFTDPLYVVLDNTATPIVFTSWPQSHGSTLPAAGDTVVVVYTQDNVPHCAGWGI